MSHQNILAAIDDEIRRLQQVRSLLQGGAGGKQAGKSRRTLSPEARERIAAAQRRRWAKQKRAAK